jgi:hypothetical protein
MPVRSRREFMGACAAGLAALGLQSEKTIAADLIGSQAFAEMVGDRFYLAGFNGTDGGKVKLIAVEGIGIAPELDQFHLRLRGGRRAQLPEGTYSATNWSGHPNFDVHVQPTGVDRRGRELYIASFAQLR